MGTDASDELIRAVTPIRKELEGRLEFTLSEKDEIALAAALGKAAFAGFRAGVRAAELETRRLGLTKPLLVNVTGEGDLWQQAFGGEDERSTDGE